MAGLEPFRIAKEFGGLTMTWAESLTHVAMWGSCCALGVEGMLPGWGALIGALVGSVMMISGRNVGARKGPR